MTLGVASQIDWPGPTGQLSGSMAQFAEIEASSRRLRPGPWRTDRCREAWQTLTRDPR